MAVAPLAYLAIGATAGAIGSKLLAPKPQHVTEKTLLGDQAATDQAKNTAPPPPLPAASTETQARDQATQAAATVRRRAAAGSIGRGTVKAGSPAPRASVVAPSLIGTRTPTATLLGY